MLPGQVELGVGYRYSRAYHHFRETKRQRDRERFGSNVENLQNIWDLKLAVGITDRLSVQLSLPYVYNEFSVPRPGGQMPGTRFVSDAQGIGDLTLVPRIWVLDPEGLPQGNIQLGVGVKFPTGDSEVKAYFPDGNGNGLRRRPVDQSIQPGDGGYGLILEILGFIDIGPARIILNGSYLANPRNQNRTQPFFRSLRDPDNNGRTYNSVSDQYLGQLTVAFPVPLVPGLGLNFFGRVEGLQPRDLIGPQDGFRRPGYAFSIGPGITFSFDHDHPFRDDPSARVSHAFSVSVPITVYINRRPDAERNKGDATFAEYIILAGYSVRF